MLDKNKTEEGFYAFQQWSIDKHNLNWVLLDHKYHNIIKFQQSEIHFGVNWLDILERS